MKVFRILGRNIRDSFKSVLRNFSLSMASISSITITLLVVSISIVLSYNVNNFAVLVEKDVTIVAFIENSVTDEDIANIEEQINRLQNVETYEFQGKEDITKDMMESSDVFQNIMGGWSLDENPIQDTFLVKVTDIEQIGDTATKIKEIENVSVVKYGEGMVEQLIKIFQVVERISFIMVISLILVTAFLISNTIKITIFSRKTEIGIMRLVGASNINIKIPFILEGLFLGILGSIVPVVITTYGYMSLFKNFNGQLFSPFIKLINPAPFIYYISGILVLIGVTVGMFGSWRAVRKHLKI
ncbi:MAG: permease-like cell division protein FtsX [Bacilli bacterium]|nr:permease-like cell division protein FtsX [Bacilli bacterium]MDD4283039.1 permease-like cell division protein FtsX [Bacilli bacterium]MDD4718493.1 permease-like cell division protein FtsX [Bacilli bacterium]